VAWILLLACLPVVAWGMWLLFCYAIARLHGVDGLKATPPIAKAFPVASWVGAIRVAGQWIKEFLGPGSSQPPLPPPT